jgi:hypothetical protein
VRAGKGLGQPPFFRNGFRGHNYDISAQVLTAQKRSVDSGLLPEQIVTCLGELRLAQGNWERAALDLPFSTCPRGPTEQEG